MIKFYSNETVGGEWARGIFCDINVHLRDKFERNFEGILRKWKTIHAKLSNVLSTNFTLFSSGDFKWLSYALLNIGRPWKKVINNCILKLNNWSWNLQQQLLTEAGYCWKIWGQYLEFATLAYFPLYYYPNSFSLKSRTMNTFGKQQNIYCEWFSTFCQRERCVCSVWLGGFV